MLGWASGEKAMMDEPDAATIAEALAVIRGGLGQAEIEFVFSLTAPFFWVLRDSHGNEMVKNGSLFFLDAGQGAFAVTAAHVVTECLRDSKSPTFVQCMIGRHGKPAHPFHLGDRIIDAHAEIDIATLRFTPAEMQTIGRTVLTGSQGQWPPRLAEVDGGVTYCGYPGKGRRWLAKRELSFGVVSMGGIVTNAHDTCISIQIERGNLMQVLGDEPMPENFDFGGMSGGPVLAIVQSHTLRSWKPAGVIFQGPNPTGDASQSIAGLEIIRARPVHFIKADGTLDVERWNQSNPV
jgi:hypothetical protein